MKRGFPDEIEILAAEINTAFEERRPPHFERGNVVAWMRAINLQMLIGQVEVAEHGLRHLRDRFPDVTYASRVSDVFDNLPPEGTPLPFKNDPASDIQIVPQAQAETVLLVFCGDAGNVGLPLAVVHSWTGRLGASLIYLKDFHEGYFLDGVSSIGATRDATIAELRRIIASLGAKRIACYGGSMGVFGALHYGLILEAESVLCVGGTTNMTPEFNAFTIYERRAKILHADLPEAPLDLRRLYSVAPRPPRVRMIYGADYWDDRMHAEYMSALPCVTLEPVESCAEHNVVVELIRRGQFTKALHWLVSDV